MFSNPQGPFACRPVRGMLGVVCVGLCLAACDSFDEVNLIAGDNTVSFAQTEGGAFVRTDAGALGDVSQALPEGVVPVGKVRSPRGNAPETVVAASDTSSNGGGFNFGNITFRTARSAEREAERAAATTSGQSRSAAAADEGEDQPGLLMRLLGRATNAGDAITGSELPELGNDGLPLISFDTAQQGRAKVNKYLWNATARTLAFMPLSVADQQRGLYVTDWHMDSQQNRPERVRVDVQHLSDVIGPGAFHVTVYRQVLDGTVWRGAPTSLPAARELESRILLAAQELKIADD